MNSACACERQTTSSERSERARFGVSGPWQFSFDERRGFGGGGLREKAVDRRALDEPPLVEEQDLVAQAPRLAEVVRGHHDLGARGVESPGSRLRPRASRPGSRLAVGSSRNSTSGSQRPGAREREALLLAARQHARRPSATCARPTLSSAVACAHRARARRRRRASSAYSDIGERRAAQHHRPLEHHRLPRGAASGAAPRDAARASARAGRAAGASARSCPAPFGPRMMVRGPASISQRDPVDDRPSAGDERNLLAAARVGSEAHP